MTLRQDPIEQTPQQRIGQMEQQIQELLVQISNLQKQVVDWHSAMFAALKLILKPHRFPFEPDANPNRLSGCQKR